MSENFSKPDALEFENISKKFAPDHEVVKDLSFKVRSGEFFSILGPSGCGKTTCLRLISGLERQTKGTIRMAGRVVDNVHPHKRNVHTVFQKYALFPHLSVFDNVAFALRMKRTPEKEVKSRVERMLKMVKLEGYGGRQIQKLSGGEQQRVALVRALVNEPAILLLDEPLAALDLKLREQMQQELVAIQKQLGTTFIFVTHDQGEALTLSDRVAIMNRGRLEQIGTPTEVYEHPSSTFVAKFVGTTNIFSGKARSANAPGTISVNVEGCGEIYAKLDDGKNPPLSGEPTGIVVRPEKIRIRVTPPSGASESANGGATNVLKGVLIERIYSGPFTQIKLQVVDRPYQLMALVANQTATKMPQLKVGEKYFAVWDSSDSIVVHESLS